MAINMMQKNVKKVYAKTQNQLVRPVLSCPVLLLCLPASPPLLQTRQKSKQHHS